MAQERPVRVGIVGTSWWADAMHLPALKNHPHADVVAICGRNRENAQQLASRWEIPNVYTDYAAMLDSGHIDALVVSTSNETHYPITMRALDNRLHVLCEKPLALTYADAQHMADTADQQGVKHLVPFTYSYMPTVRYLKELIDGGYIGTPYHLNMRYYAGYGRKGDYMWRFDLNKAGAGALGDIGSHFIYIAQWLFGTITSVCCHLSQNVPRPILDPDGKVYPQADDNAVILLQFENGAQGTIQASTVAYENTPFGQTHHMEFHGSDGTLYSFTDWDKTQRVSGAKAGKGALKPLRIPERIWNGARHDTVHNTYRDVFRQQNWMTRQFIRAITHGDPTRPTFQDGARVQRVVDAGLQSARQRCWVDVESVT